MTDLLPFLFPIAFLVSALLTKKDLAFYCAAASFLSILVHIRPDWAIEVKLMANAGITTGLAVLSGYRMIAKEDRTALAPWICFLSCLSIANNLLQSVMLTSFSYYFGIAVGLSMLIALIFIDGRREFWHDLADDFNLYRDSGIFGHRSQSHKGHH